MMPVNSRREFFKVSAAAAFALALTRLADQTAQGTELANPAGDRRFISTRDVGVIAAIAAAVLAGSLPAEPGARQAAIDETVAAFDRTVAGLPPAIQAEVAQLLSLLGWGITRRLVAGLAKPWAEASEADVKAFLNNWRQSRFATLQQGYQALVRVLIACWYGNARAWPQIGYPGPPLAAQLGGG
jgi:hypothetical protein